MYEQDSEGGFTLKDKPYRPQAANFVIICGYGDWSGFLTLAECERRFPELQRYYQESKGERWFAVEER